MPERPLSHLRVLDFGQYLAGPLVGMMLADMGAEVIRIDPPGGLRRRSPAAAMLSRGKSSLMLDLKVTQDRAIALELCRRSDVLIENFRPGVMGRLGLGPDVLENLNPALVTLSMPGFASTDPELADVAAWEAVIAARTGQFTDMGLNRRLMGINPSFTPLGLASAYGAAFGAMAVLLALAVREQHGGDHIEVPLAAALLEGLAYNCEQIEDYPLRYRSPREVELGRRSAAGLPMDLSFEALCELLDPFYRTYPCADGRGFYVVSCSVAEHPRRTLEVLGLGHLLDELPDFDAYLDHRDWPDEWTLRSYPVGPRDRERLASAMKAAFLTKPAVEWEELFGAARAPGTAQRSTAEWLTDPHALSSGLILEVDDLHHGRMRQMGNIAWLADDSAAMTKQSSPTLDGAREALAQILAEPARPFVTRQRTSGWLEGLKVLDLTNVIAGPTIGSTLARFGAEVTLVQPVIPSVDPWNAVVFGLQAQRGKKSVLLNLKTTEGQEVLTKLLTRVDVVTVNATDQQRDRLGLAPERLEALNPRLILVQLDAFGGPMRGPKSDHLGYDDLAQAATGVMHRFGGGMATPEEHAHFGTIDVLAGLCGCVALAGALQRRDHTGRGGVARTSLAAAGNLIQASFMYDHEGREPFNEPAGRGARGWGPFYRCYQAADGWMFFAAPTERQAALHRFPELSGLADQPEQDLEEALVERFAGRSCSYWREGLEGTSSAVIPLGSLHSTCDASLRSESAGDLDVDQATYSVIRHDRHPMERWVDLVAPRAVRPRHGTVSIPAPMSKPGSHTRQVLHSLSYQPSTIAAMFASGAAGDRWSDKFLPE